MRVSAKSPGRPSGDQMMHAPFPGPSDALRYMSKAKHEQKASTGHAAPIDFPEDPQCLALEHKAIEHLRCDVELGVGCGEDEHEQGHVDNVHECISAKLERS